MSMVKYVGISTNGPYAGVSFRSYGRRGAQGRGFLASLGALSLLPFMVIGAIFYTVYLLAAHSTRRGPSPRFHQNWSK